ncbi:MAG: hypothetical protein U9Q98_09995 [Bacteroidota bacterium]|nr:hypothetical protein [Bacteroidota bacterium]
MKKITLLLTVFIMLLLSFSCNRQEQNEFSKKEFILPNEYVKLNDLEKSIANYINTSIGALKGMEINGASDKYITIFSIEENQSPDWEGMFFFYNTEDEEENIIQDIKASQECQITNKRSAFRCAKKIAKFVKENRCASIEITYSDGTYNVSWEKC